MAAIIETTIWTRASALRDRCRGLRYAIHGMIQLLTSKYDFNALFFRRQVRSTDRRYLELFSTPSFESGIVLGPTVRR